MSTDSSSSTDSSVPPDAAVGPGTSGASPVDVQAAEFANFKPGGQPLNSPDWNRFHDVQIMVSAELGRTKIPIQKLLQLGPGAIVELNRSINSPVELIAQGIPLASGEVVVVNDCFAIRIREIYSQTQGDKPSR